MSTWSEIPEEFYKSSEWFLLFPKCVLSVLNQAELFKVVPIWSPKIVSESFQHNRSWRKLSEMPKCVSKTGLQLVFCFCQIERNVIFIEKHIKYCNAKSYMPSLKFKYIGKKSFKSTYSLSYYIIFSLTSSLLSEYWVYLCSSEFWYHL